MITNDCMLTTVDNPFDPFEQFALWDKFDREKGYFTCQYLARLVHLSEDMTQMEEDEEIDRAMNKIILNDPFNIYKKVEKSTDLHDS